MNAQSSNRYSSTKFAVLSDGESIRTAKRNYFIWITGVTLIFCVTVAYFSYKMFIVRNFFHDPAPQSFDTTDTRATVSHLLSQYPGHLVSRLKNKSQRNRNEFSYEESQIQDTIPVMYLEQILQKDFKNLQDFINLDLLLYYEYLINKFDIERLRIIFNEYQLKVLLLKSSDDLVNFFMSLKSEKLKFYGLLLKEQKYDIELQQFGSFFALTEELNHWYNYLHRLSNFLPTYEQQKLKKHFGNCTSKNFEKFTEKTQKELFRFAYPFKIIKKKLEEINRVISMWSEPTITKFYNCSLIFYRSVLLLSDVNEEIQRSEAQCLKNVFAFASSIIYLDKDLELPGVNLAIVSPVWLFLDKTYINLNGLMAIGFTNATATFSESGTPGNPGGNAGDFLGAGNFHQKFLVISANGGKGANGQDGAKGPDGVDFTRPSLSVNKPTCVLKINTYSNTFGQTITHYKVFNPLGCGRSGTDGGVGGSGGAGGVITLITNNSINISKGINGTAGTSGKGGAGGKGGRNGCFYEVLDVDDETLHPITRVKCPIENTLPSGKDGKDNYNSQGQVFLPAKETLDVQNTLHQYIKLTEQDVIKYNNPNLISFLKHLLSLHLHNETNVKNLITEYKCLEWFNKIEFYEIFKEKIIKYLQNASYDSRLPPKYLVSAALGKILILKKNINFYFIDSKHYLNVVERSIKTSNERNREPQNVSYFKNKVRMKIEEVKKNFNRIKMKSITLTLNSGNYKSEELNEEKMSYYVISAIDVLCSFLNPTFGGIKGSEFSKLFQGNSSLLPHVSVPYESDYADLSTFRLAEKSLVNIVKNLQNNNTGKIEEDFSNFRDVLFVLKESKLLSNQIKTLLESLTDEIEHFLALFNFLDWEKLEISFFKSLNGLTLDPKLEFEEDNEVKFLKSQLIDVVIALQCKLAVQTVRLSTNSFEDLPSCSHLSQKGTVTDDKNLQQNTASVNTDLFRKNHLIAIFDKHSAVGEFYFWPNSQIKNKLRNLFSGTEIYLKSDIINDHIFDKNFIQFTSLKLDFETNNKSSAHLLEGILSHMKIQMIHSGYSYYNWKGETHVIVSEKVNLEYSFKMQDSNEPEVFNSLYKKCKEGEIKLSPFTTWTLRLLPIKDAIDSSKLMPFADSVSLRLIGTGTYIS